MINLSDINSPLYSQDGKGDDKVIVAKLFALGSGATWYVTEFDPEDRLIFSYVTGLQEDEWGYASLEELESLKYGPIPRIERDEYWTPITWGELKGKVGAMR